MVGKEETDKKCTLGNGLITSYLQISPMDAPYGFIDVFWSRWLYLNSSRTLRLVDKIRNKTFKCSAAAGVSSSRVSEHPGYLYKFGSFEEEKQLSFSIGRAVTWKKDALILSHKTQPWLAGRVTDFASTSPIDFSHNSPMIE